ncbi:uncharacterized protein LOC110179667 [Drosophila serrata]|uniref:uncharacterized protein LOC110179667 n=1 Tax=Drosophila serrata TaxID=7274 RepID=UPI000A1D0007|nr:uncharacterized protein LOC110179667 [Drosophila serrata]
MYRLHTDYAVPIARPFLKCKLTLLKFPATVSFNCQNFSFAYNMSYAYFDNVLREVRVLLTDTPASLIRVLRAYKKKYGVLLPHRRLGFSTPEEFLRTSGEFNMFKRGNEVFISAKPDDANVPSMRSRAERIQELMRRQAMITIVTRRRPGRRRG